MVIIILIFVFDPLAILLVLAAHISLMRRFPKLQVNTEKIFEKQAELQEEKKLLDSKEKDLIERKKDIEEQETVVDLKEKQIEKYIRKDLGYEPRHNCESLASAITDIANELDKRRNLDSRKIFPEIYQCLQD